MRIFHWRKEPKKSVIHSRPYDKYILRENLLTEEKSSKIIVIDVEYTVREPTEDHMGK